MWQGDGTVADPSPSPGSAPLRAGLLGLALVAALALLAATFSDVIPGSCTEKPAPADPLIAVT